MYGTPVNIRNKEGSNYSGRDGISFKSVFASSKVDKFCWESPVFSGFLSLRSSTERVQGMSYESCN